ncbi:MAG: hypothetical protein ACP5N2_04010 [Candidatus Nanoarchaeia archaeon]
MPIIYNNDDADLLSGLLRFDDPIEKARNMEHLLKTDKAFRERYELEQKIKKNEQEIKLLERWGIYPRSHELPRRDYLPRLTEIEQNNLCDLLDYIFYKTARKISFGVLAVGTITYSDEYWKSLELLANLPNATYEEIEVNYSDQKETRQKKTFNMKKVLKDKGADIDIKLCQILDFTDSDKDYVKPLRDAAIQFANEKNIKFKQYTKRQSIVGTKYYTEPPLAYLKENEPVVVQRHKVKSVYNRDSISLKFHKGRAIHIYFDILSMFAKLAEERSEGYEFSTITMNHNAFELREVIAHGRKTGIYEHPVLIPWQDYIQTVFQAHSKSNFAK